MLYIIVLIATAFLIAILWEVYTRRKLKQKSAYIASEIINMASFAGDSTAFEGIYNEFLRSYKNIVVTIGERQDFAQHFEENYRKAIDIRNRLGRRNIKASHIILEFIQDFESIEELITKNNNRLKSILLEEEKEFFDNCLAYPLDYNQRLSIISNELNTLVISSAGSGKTSTIIGKVKYLTEIENVDPKEILLISYTYKAAKELSDRCDVEGIRGYTFHKLAMDIIAESEKIKPSIAANSEGVINEIYRELLNKKSFRKRLVEYYLDYRVEESEEEKKEWEAREKLSKKKSRQIKAQYPDMDGRDIYVRSMEESKICLALSSLGISFRYEAPYEYKVANEFYSQYRPDFSIFYEEEKKTKRLYLEHFGIDRDGLVPQWFAEEKTYHTKRQIRDMVMVLSGRGIFIRSIILGQLKPLAPTLGFSIYIRS